MRLVSLMIAVTTGMLMAIGGYTFVYARGSSYLTNDPAACANCHVVAIDARYRMIDQLSCLEVRHLPRRCNYV